MKLVLDNTSHNISSLVEAAALDSNGLDLHQLPTSETNKPISSLASAFIDWSTEDNHLYSLVERLSSTYRNLRLKQTPELTLKWVTGLGATYLGRVQLALNDQVRMSSENLPLTIINGAEIPGFREALPGTLSDINEHFYFDVAQLISALSLAKSFSNFYYRSTSLGLHFESISGCLTNDSQGILTLCHPSFFFEDTFKQDQLDKTVKHVIPSYWLEMMKRYRADQDIASWMLLDNEQKASDIWSIYYERALTFSDLGMAAKVVDIHSVASINKLEIDTKIEPEPIPDSSSKHKSFSHAIETLTQKHPLLEEHFAHWKG